MYGKKEKKVQMPMSERQQLFLLKKQSQTSAAGDGTQGNTDISHQESLINTPIEIKLRKNFIFKYFVTSSRFAGSCPHI